MFTVRRLLAATAAAVAAVAVLPAPAQAAPAPFTFAVHDLGVTPAGKVARLDLRSLPGAPAQLKNVKVVIDTTEVAGFATAWVLNYTPDGKRVPAKECTVDGAVTTCTWAARTNFIEWLPNLVVEAKKGAEVGRTGKLPITVSADGLDKLTATPTITVAEDVDLAAGPAGQQATVAGDTLVKAPIEIRNAGRTAVNGVVARFTAETAGLRIAGSYTNCVYRANGDEAWCRFDQKLEPGTSYRVGAPVIKSLADLKGDDDQFTYLHMWFTADDIDESGGAVFTDGQMKPGTDGVLRLESVVSTLKTTDSNGRNNLAFGFVTIKDAASPSPSPSVTPTATASPTPTPTATAGAAAGGSGGGLAITGVSTPLVAGVGIAFLLAGLFALRLGRRRTDG